MEISSAESLLSQVRDYQAKIASARRDNGDLGSIPSIGDAGRGQGVPCVERNSAGKDGGNRRPDEAGADKRFHSAASFSSSSP